MLLLSIVGAASAASSCLCLRREKLAAEAAPTRGCCQHAAIPSHAARPARVRLRRAAAPTASPPRRPPPPSPPTPANRARAWPRPGSRAGYCCVDRKSVVSGKSVSVRVDLGGRRIIKKKKDTQKQKYKQQKLIAME